MAIYDLEEQEQIAALKNFWRDYGRLLIAGAVAFVVGVGGTQAWKHYKRNQAQAASAQFVKLEEALDKGDVTEIRNVGDGIINAYPGTPYAPMAALVIAKTEHDSGELDAAASRLEWVIENAGNDEVRILSRLRLAGVFLDQEKYDAALQLLDGQESEAFAALYANLRGDVLVAQGKPDEARAQYQQALEKSQPDPSWRDVVQLKLDALRSQ